MRISTTAFLLTCTVLFFSALDALAAPGVTITNVKQACGTNFNGSFIIRVGTMTGTNLSIQVFGSAPYVNPPPTVITNPVLPFEFPVTNLPGGQTYLVVVTDASGFDTKFQSITDFSASETHQNNLDPDCSSPNGSITITMNGAGTGAFQFSWAGPVGFVDPGTQSLTNLRGGEYTLTYTDSNPDGVTSCTLAPIRIDDPSASDFTIDTPSTSVCEHTGFVVNVHDADAGYTYDVMENTTVIASGNGAGGPLPINVAALPAGPHTLRVRASQGACSVKFNSSPDLSITILPAPDYNSSPMSAICSGTAIGLNLNSLKKATSVVATSFVIVDPISAPGLTMITGSPTNVAVAADEIQDDVWRNFDNVPHDVTYTIGTFANSCPGNVITVVRRINPEPDYNDFSNIAPAGICSKDLLGVADLELLKKPTSITATSYSVTALDFTGLTAAGGMASTTPPFAVAKTDLANDQWQNLDNVSHNVIYTIVPVTGGCPGEPFTVTVTVNPQPDYNNYNNNNVAGGICSEELVGVDLTTLVKSTSAPATSFILDDIDEGLLTPAGGGIPAAFPVAITATDLADDQWRNVQSANISVIYKIRPAIGPCIGEQFTVTVTIKPQPDYNSYNNDNAPNICSEDAIAINLSDLKKAPSVAASSFAITIDSHGMAQTAGAATPQDIADDKWENITAASLDVEYSIVPTTNGCDGDEFTVIVTVAPEPDYTNYNDDNAPGGICSDDALGIDLSTLQLGASVAATAYRIDEITPETGLTIGAGSPVADPNIDKTATEIADDSWINATAAALKVTYKIRPKTACFGDQFTVIVTINPRPSYKDYNDDLAPGGICATPLGIDLQTLMNTGSIAATAFTVDNVVSTDLVQVAGMATANDISDDVWSNITNTDKVVTYTITPTAGICEGDDFEVKVTIKPQPDYADGPLLVCSGTILNYSLDATKSATSITATSFNVTNIDPLSPDLVAKSGVATGTGSASIITDDVWTNTTNGPLVVEYTIIPSVPGGCVGASFKITVTVLPEPVYNTSPLITLCSEDMVGIDLETLKESTSVSAVTFDIVALPDAGLTPVGATNNNDTGDNMIIANDQWRNVSNAVLNVNYVVIGRSADNCPTTAAFDVPVAVNPQPDYDDLPATPICSGATVGVDVTTLRKSTSVVADGFNVVADPNGLTQLDGAATPNNIADDVWENLTSASVDIEYTITPSIGPCAGDDFTVIVSILPSPVYNDYTNDDAPGGICSQDAIGVDFVDLHVATSVVATSFAITDNAPAGLTVVSTDPNVISDDVWKNTTTGPVDVIYTIIPTAGICEGPEFKVTVTVNPEPAVLDVGTDACSGTAVNFDLETVVDINGNALSTASFTWVADDNLNVTGETLLTPEPTSTITDVLVNTTTVDQDVTYTVIPTSALGCEGASFKVTVSIPPLPVLKTPQGEEICGNTQLAYEILLDPANQPAGTRFKWNDPDGAGPATAGDVDAGPLGTIHITDVLVNNTAPFIDVVYSVTPYRGSCEGVPQDVTIRVYQPAIVEAGNPESICFDNGAYTLIGSLIDLAATTATWAVFSEPTPGHAVINQPSPSNPATSTFTATLPGEYILALTSNIPAAPSVCLAVTDFVTITVLEKPVIAPAQATIVCANDPVDYAIQMLPAGIPVNTVFNWPAPANPGGEAGADVALGAPGTFHITDLLRNDSPSNIDVTYNITPSVGLCVGDPVNITVTVKPGPVLALNQTKTICSGDRVDWEILLDPAGTPANTTFSWPDPDGSGPATSKLNVDAGAPGTIHIDDVLFNGTGSVLTVNYSVIAKGANGCNGVVREVAIQVNPGAVAEAGSPQTVCSGGVATLSGSSFGGTATEGTWSIALNPSGGDGVITQLDPTAPETATFKATVGGNYTLRLTTDDPDGVAGCSEVSDVVVITVRAIGDPSCTGNGGGDPCDKISVQPVPTPATCNNADGSVEFLITNIDTGLPAFPVSGDIEITVDGEDFTAPRTNVNNTVFDVLNFGKYEYVVIFGDDGCVKPDNGDGSFTIPRSGTIGEAIVSNLINPTCFGETGTATINVPGETGNILQWSVNGIDFHNFVAGNPVTGLPGGLIAVQRTGDPCAAGVVIDFNMPAEIPVQFIPANATCTGTDGTIQAVNTLNGTAPYIFEIEGVQTILPADSVFRGFTAGTYDIVVRDSRGCTKTFDPVFVGQVVGPASLDTLYVKTGISVPDLPSGSALVGVNPSGLEPYETRLELVQPLFASQEYVSDWSEVPLNPLNLKFEQSYTNIFAGVYSLGLRDAGGCTKMYVINIDVDTQLFIPNIFTPNEDGHNDVFYIRNLPTDAQLLVTNRWGNEVYKSSSYQNDWAGGDTADGMYYYTLKLGGQAFTGWVEILRGQ